MALDKRTSFNNPGTGVVTGGTVNLSQTDRQPAVVAGMAEGSRAMDAVLSGQLDLESYLKGRLQQAEGGRAAAKRPGRLSPPRDPQANTTKRRPDYVEEEEDFDDEESEEDIPGDLYDEWGLEEGEIPQGDFPTGFQPGHHLIQNAYAGHSRMRPARGMPPSRSYHPRFQHRPPLPQGQMPPFERRPVQQQQQQHQGMQHQVNYLQRPSVPHLRQQPRGFPRQVLPEQHSQRVPLQQDYEETATDHQHGSGQRPLPQKAANPSQKKRGAVPAEQGRPQQLQQKLQPAQQQQQQKMHQLGQPRDWQLTAPGTPHRDTAQKRPLPSRQERDRLLLQAGQGSPQHRPKSQKQSEYREHHPLDYSSESESEDERIQMDWFRNQNALLPRENRGKAPLHHDSAHRPMPGVPPGERIEIDDEEEEYYEGCDERLPVDFEDELSEDELEFAEAERARYAEYHRQRMLAAEGGRHPGQYRERLQDKSGMAVLQHRDNSKPLPPDRQWRGQSNSKANPSEQVCQSRLPLARPVLSPESTPADLPQCPSASKGRRGVDEQPTKQQDSDEHKPVAPAEKKSEPMKEHSAESVPKGRVCTDTVPKGRVCTDTDSKPVTDKAVVPKETVTSVDKESSVSDKLAAREKIKGSDRPIVATMSSPSTDSSDANATAAADSDMDVSSPPVSPTVALSDATPKPCQGRSVEEPVCLLSDSDEDDGRPLACLEDERPPSDEDEEEGEEDSSVQDSSIVSISVDEESDEPERSKDKTQGDTMTSTTS